MFPFASKLTYAYKRILKILDKIPILLLPIIFTKKSITYDGTQNSSRKKDDVYLI